MSKKLITEEIIETLKENFNDSRSITVIWLLHEKYSFSEDFLNLLQKDEKFLSDILRVIPHNFSHERKRLSILLINKNRTKLKFVLELIKDDCFLQKFILDSFQKK